MLRSALLIFVAALALRAGSEGVTVDAGGPLLHRSSVEFPREALARNIEGTVVLELSLDRNGEVAGATVVSGPAELRRAALESVPAWHYSSEMSLPAKVQATITFKLTGSPAPLSPRSACRLNRWERSCASRSAVSPRRRATPWLPGCLSTMAIRSRRNWWRRPARSSPISIRTLRSRSCRRRKARWC